MSGDILILSKRSESAPAPKGYTIIDITRTGSLRLGNESALLAKDNMTARLQSLADHRVQVKRDFDKKGHIYTVLHDLAARLKKGENFVFLCWCAPLPCHGEHYRELVYEIAGIPLPAKYRRPDYKEPPPPQMALF